MTGTEGFIGGMSALALAAVYWAYDKIVRHDRDIGVLMSHHQAILVNLEDLKVGQTKQSDICRQVLMSKPCDHGGRSNT